MAMIPSLGSAWAHSHGGLAGTGNAVGMSVAQASHGHAYQNAPSPNDRFTSTNLSFMLSVRMGWTHKMCPFETISCHKLNAEMAVVFLIVGGKALLIEDDLNLFPSDALVTQLRLMEGV